MLERELDPEERTLHARRPLIQPLTTGADRGAGLASRSHRMPKGR
jgi:hypothetical protein